ncbi:subtilisin-like protease SBT1.5 [Forsythia ovata]|uniref:Subtilisin-like protease SBT1.5 n=1 Tax=Forsythia ovata TaxID=205694 RepID=A0ABD1UVS7_9LAMI
MRVRLELIEPKIQQQCTVHRASTRLYDEFFSHQSSTTSTTDAPSDNPDLELAKEKNRLRFAKTAVHSQNTLDSSTKTVPISIPQPTSPMPKSSLTLLLIVIVIALADAEKHRKTFIIHVERDAKPSIFPTHKNWYESMLRSLSTIAIDGKLSDSTDVSSVIHTYETVFHGFSSNLSTSEAQKIETLTGIVAVIHEQVRHVHMTRFLEFIGLKTSDNAGLLKELNFGSDLAGTPVAMILTFWRHLTSCDWRISGVVVQYYLDNVAIGAFGTSDAEIFVSASTGNGGPEGLTVTNVAPCVTTMGGGNIDRDFPANIKLEN